MYSLYIYIYPAYINIYATKSTKTNGILGQNSINTNGIFGQKPLRVMAYLG